MILAPVDLTPAERHELGGLTAAARNAVELGRLYPELAAAAALLRDDAAAELAAFWRRHG